MGGEEKTSLRRLEADLQERRNRSAQSRQQRKINWFLLSPLMFAPLLPLIRITLRNHPVIRDRAFKFTIGVALAHGATLAMGFYNNEADAVEEGSDA